jgi:peptidoglycan/LPS O-acetylase OafA/YrhL
MHFRELDGIRGLLSFIILLFHLGLNPLVGLLTFGLIPEGRYELAVDFFFILSGFVLCHVSTGRRPGVLRFLAGRAFRMLPVAVVSLGLCLLANHSADEPAALFANLLLVQLFLGLPHLNRVAWSACSEMWMPAFLGLGAWFGRKQGRTLLLSLLLLMWALVGFALSEHAPENSHFIDVLRSFAGLSAGFLLCMLFPASAVEPVSPAPALIPGLLLFAVGLIMVFGGKYGVLVYAFPPVAGFTILGFLRTKTFLSGRVCQFLGARSYSLYMLHWPVLLFFSSHFGPEDLKGNVSTKLAIIIASLFLADLTHRFVELPFLRLRGTLMPGRA